MMNFNFRGERTTKTTTNAKTDHNQALPSSASLLNRSVGRRVGKRTSAFTIFVTVSLIAILLLLASPSFHHLPQAQAQGAALNPATMQIINQK